MFGECLGIVRGVFGSFRDTLRSSGAVLLKGSGGGGVPYGKRNAAIHTHRTSCSCTIWAAQLAAKFRAANQQLLPLLIPKYTTASPAVEQKAKHESFVTMLDPEYLGDL